MYSVGFGLIGCGAIGMLHAGILSDLDGARLVSAYDSNPQSAARVAQRFGCSAAASLGEVLARNDIDAVVVCTPSGLHPEAVEAAARAGKHVVCEKPLGISAEQAKRMISVCDRCGVKLYPIFQHRFSDAVQSMKQALGTGKWGRVYWGSAHVILYRDDAYYRQSPWRGTLDMDGGALLNQSIHYIDLLIWLLGRPVSVMGMCASRRGITEAEDVGAGCVRFENGCLGSIEGTTDARPGLYSEVSLYAEQGSVICRNECLTYISAPGLEALDARKATEALYTKQQGAGISPDNHRRQYADILRSMRTGCAPQVTARDALQTLCVLLALRESSETGREISIASLMGEGEPEERL